VAFLENKMKRNKSRRAAPQKFCERFRCFVLAGVAFSGKENDWVLAALTTFRFGGNKMPIFVYAN
jgi:hypothetical protein